MTPMSTMTTVAPARPYPYPHLEGVYLRQRAQADVDWMHVISVPLDAVAEGLTARHHIRTDPTYGYQWPRVQVYPTGIDPDTHKPFTTPFAEIEWSQEHTGYLVHVSGARSGAYVQAGGKVRIFNAVDAMDRACMEIRWDLAMPGW